MTGQRDNALVTTDWLAERLGAPGIRVVDASWYLPTEGRNPAAEFEDAHIPGAVFFDIDGISDPDSALPHMLPSAELFAERVGALGICNDDLLVVYDGAGLFSAPRVWWTFRVFGHEAAVVLSGGMPRWRAEGRALESGPAATVPAKFHANYRSDLVRSREQVLRNVSDDAEQVVDARSRGRFDGTEPEPRAGLRSGHIPGSVSLPYADVADVAAGTLPAADLLRARFEAEGVDLNRPIVTTCGSGISAALLALALYQIGHDQAAVYDGSWTEWGGRDDTPVKP